MLRTIRLLFKRKHSLRFSHSKVCHQTLRPIWPKLVTKCGILVQQQKDGRIPLLPPSHQRVVDRKTAPSKKSAAVLVLLVMIDELPSLVFTQRSAHLSQHAAQISFPGGHFEEGEDQTLTETAVREAKEELYAADSVPPLWADLEILGSATPLPSIRGVPVTPVIAGLLDTSLAAHDVPHLWPGNPSEVDFVFTVAIRDLVANESTRAIPATEFNPSNPSAPIFPTPQGPTIWGLTAYALRPLLHNLFRPILCPEAQTKE